MLLRLTTAAIQEIGSTPHGTLSIFPVTGGSFEGERLRGKVLAGGGDWVTAKADGTFELDVRVTLETDDGALIHMTFTGMRDDGFHQRGGAIRAGPTVTVAARTGKTSKRLRRTKLNQAVAWIRGCGVHADRQ